MTTISTQTAPALLESIDQIDTAWLEAALSATHPRARIAGFSTRPVGAGNVSDTVAIAIDYTAKPDGAPDSVVAKFRPRDAAVHAHGLASGAYHRELGAYQTIAANEHCRMPGLFHVAGDETNINLVVEDLTSARPGNQVAGCDVESAQAVLKELAGLHASFPMDPATAPAWPIRLPEVADYWTEKVHAGERIIKERFASTLTAADLEAVAGAAEVVHAWHLLTPGRQTLTHGDPRVDNVLFEEVDAGVGAVLIDWQVCGIRNPMYDVGYFLSGSISVDDRREHEDRLLAEYVQKFNAISAEQYDLEEARADFSVQVLSGLIITTAAIAVLPDNDQVNTLIHALLERNCAAVIDWNTLEATREALEQGARQEPGSTDCATRNVTRVAQSAASGRGAAR